MEEGLAGSASVLLRGELLLTGEEAARLNEKLEAAHNAKVVSMLASSDLPSSRCRWRFHCLSEKPATSGPSGSRLISSSPHPTKRVSEFGAGKGGGVSTSAANLRKMPDWVQRFHRLLMSFSQQERAKPFNDYLPHKDDPMVFQNPSASSAGLPSMYGTTPSGMLAPSRMTRHSSAALQKREIEIDVHPHINPVGWAGILNGLEKGKYTSQVEVFNEIYNLFLAGFRHYPPGSPHWMNCHQLVSEFFALASNYPLKDDLSLLWREEFMATRARKTQEALKRKSAPSNIGQPGYTGGGVAAAAERTPPLTRPRQPSMKPRPPQKYATAPIESRERKTFQFMLTKLPLDQHIKLFENFRTKAVWKEVFGGQVELDDAMTKPEIFREMMVWCHDTIREAAYNARLAANKDKAAAGLGGAGGAAPTVRKRPKQQTDGDDDDYNPGGSKTRKRKRTTAAHEPGSSTTTTAGVGGGTAGYYKYRSLPRGMVRADQGAGDAVTKTTQQASTAATPQGDAVEPVTAVPSTKQEEAASVDENSDSLSEMDDDFYDEFDEDSYQPDTINITL